MKKRRIILSVLVLTAALLLPLAACSTLPASIEPSAPVTSKPPETATSEPPTPPPSGPPEYIILEPRFTIDTVPEYGNINTYLKLLYEPKDTVLDALSLSVPDIEQFLFLSQTETLWERDFSVMLRFIPPSNRLQYFVYTLKVPRETAEEETARIRSSLIDLYGQPDLRNLYVEHREPDQHWTLDKNHATATEMEVLPSISPFKDAESICVYLELSCKSSPLVTQRDDPPDPDMMYITLTYDLAAYYPPVLLPGDEGWPY